MAEAYLAPFRDYRHARSLLVDDWYTEDRWVEVAGEAVRLHLAVHEGQAWDEIYVQAALFDEPIVPRVAEVGFYLMG